jgi:hypothetical protein
MEWYTTVLLWEIYVPATMDLYVPVFERKYIPTNMNSLNTLHTKVELKQQNVQFAHGLL